MRKTAAASPLAATWQTQLRDLASALRSNPDSPLAWRWRTRVRVLKFLLSRYGSNPNMGSPPREKMRAAPSVTPIPNLRPPHTRERIRRTLDHIVAVRHVTAPWQIVLVKGADRNRTYITLRQLW